MAVLVTRPRRSPRAARHGPRNLASTVCSDITAATSGIATSPVSEPVSILPSHVDERALEVDATTDDDLHPELTERAREKVHVAGFESLSLEHKLELLTLQRHVAATRCEAFLRELENEAQQARGKPRRRFRRVASEMNLSRTRQASSWRREKTGTSMSERRFSPSSANVELDFCEQGSSTPRKTGLALNNEPLNKTMMPLTSATPGHWRSLRSSKSDCTSANF